MEKTKILIVEDEPKIAQSILQALIDEGYAAYAAFDGKQALQYFNESHFHLVILDLNVPHYNGQELCRIFRRSNPSQPILVLTALGDIDSKVALFDLGVDDYMVKPFHFKELISRVKAIIKRFNGFELDNSPVSLADLTLYPEKKLVVRAGKEISLTAKEFALFELLLRNKEKVFSKAEITEKIWDMRFDPGTNVVEVYINFLRKKIDKDFEQKLIHTKTGLGYYVRE